MKNAGIMAIVALIYMTTALAAPAVAQDAAESLGWKLGMQAWSFKDYTLFEAIDKTASLGMRSLEAYPGQRIRPSGDERMLPGISPELRQEIMDKLDSAGVTLVNFGVATCQNEDDWRTLFAFAKEMGVKTIASEPAPEWLPLVEELCDSYGINVAIHNHPKPTPYWSPDIVLKALGGRSKRLGVCADTGHWKRSGLDPVACLKKLEGRVVSVHLKDLQTETKPYHDVPWGTGACNVFGILTELKRQGFKGMISCEYEHNMKHSMPQIRESAEYFRLATAALVEDGYKPLFQPDLSNAIFPDMSWTFQDGVLTAHGGGDIWTKARYGDFALTLEFQCEPYTNSGVFVRCGDIDEWLHTAIEVQILQPETPNPRHNCGAIFDCSAPSKQMVKAPGQWNRYVILARDNMLYVVLNGVQVISMNLDRWTEAHKNPDGTTNKFNSAYRDMPREGHVGLQYHGQPIRFRNMSVKPLGGMK